MFITWVFGQFLKSSPTTFSFFFEVSLIAAIVNKTSKLWWILAVIFFVLSLLFTKMMTEINITTGYQQKTPSLFMSNYISAIMCAPIVFPLNLLSFIFFSFLNLASIMILKR